MSDSASEHAVNSSSANASPTGSPDAEAHGPSAPHLADGPTNCFEPLKRLVLFAVTLSAGARLMHQNLTSLTIIKLVHEGNAIKSWFALFQALEGTLQLRRLDLTHTLPDAVGRPASSLASVRLPHLRELVLEDTPPSCERFLLSVTVPAVTRTLLKFSRPIKSTDASRSLANALGSTGIFRDPSAAKGAAVDACRGTLCLHISDNANSQGLTSSSTFFAIVFHTEEAVQDAVALMVHLPLQSTESLTIYPRYFDYLPEYWLAIVDRAFPSIKKLTVGRPLFTSTFRALSQARAGVLEAGHPRFFGQCSALAFVGMVYPQDVSRVNWDLFAAIADIRGSLGAPVDYLSLAGYEVSDEGVLLGIFSLRLI